MNTELHTFILKKLNDSLYVIKLSIFYSVPKKLSCHPVIDKSRFIFDFEEHCKYFISNIYQKSEKRIIFYLKKLLIWSSKILTFKSFQLK